MLPLIALFGECWTAHAWRAGMFFPPLLLASYLVVFVSGILRFAVPFAKAQSTHVALDRDGLRVVARKHAMHWPYELLGSARIDPPSNVPARLCVETRTGQPVVDLPLLDSAAESTAAVLLREFAERRTRRDARTDVPSLLPRRGCLSIDDWIAALDRLAPLVRGWGGYRHAALGTNALQELLEDESTPTDARAGAAYLLLRHGTPDAAANTARSLDLACAPLVLALAARAVPDLPNVPRRALREAMDFVDAA